MSGFINLPEDIIIEILSYFSLYRIIRLETVCKYLQTLIRNTKWNHTFRIERNEAIDHVCRTYIFSKLVIPDKLDILTSDDMIKFGKYDNLSLDLDKLCPSFENISNCQHLKLNLNNLPYTDFRILEYLTNLKSLKLNNGYFFGGVLIDNNKRILKCEIAKNLTKLSLGSIGLYFREKILMLTKLKELSLPKDITLKNMMLCTILTNLEKLKIKHIDGFDLSTFTILTNLKCLKLDCRYSKNSVSMDTLESMFKYLTNITAFEYYPYDNDNTLSKYFKIMDFLTKLNSLKLHCSLYSYKIGDEYAINNLTNLKSLAIEGYCVKTTSGYELYNYCFEKLTNLTYLDVDNQLNNLKLDHLTKLSKLVISSSFQSEINEIVLEKMKKLDVLYIKTPMNFPLMDTKIFKQIGPILKGAGVSIITKQY